MKRCLVGLAACVAALLPATAQAAFQSNPPGFTEIIACHAAYEPIHFFRDWNNLASSSFNSKSIGGDPWWNYAQPGNGGHCRDWVRAQVPGGTGFVQGQPSLPQGALVNLRPYWADTMPTTEAACGHQHTALYAWGWRYNGSTWSLEFVGSTATMAVWNSSTNKCEFRGDIPNGIPGISYGKGVVTIKNSPYAVLWVSSQASSHRSAGCGQFGCFHPVRTTYSLIDTTL